MSNNIKLFGFFNNEKNEYPQFGFPQIDNNWRKSQFIHKLMLLQEKSLKINYKGSSRCRFCDKDNGSSEYLYQIKKISIKWPSGYLHYIIEHNVRPEKDFIDFVLNFK